MCYRLLTAVVLLMFVVGCGEEVKPSKEIIKLQGMDSADVVYTYEAIVAMSDSDLDKNILALRERITRKRSGLPPSAAGATIGGGDSETIESEEVVDPDADASLESLALPYEVMLQEQAGRK